MKKSYSFVFYGKKHKQIILSISELIDRFGGDIASSDFSFLNTEFSGIMHIKLDECQLAGLQKAASNMSRWLHTDIILTEQLEYDKRECYNVSAWGANQEGINSILMKGIYEQGIEIINMQSSTSLDNTNQELFSTSINVHFRDDIEDIQAQLDEVAKSLELELIVTA